MPEQVLVGALSAIVSFLVGFLAQPIKDWYTNRVKVDQLRKSIYKEIAYLYHYLKTLEDREERGLIRIDNTLIANLRLIPTTCYRYALQNPLLFYQLEEVTYIEIIFKKLDSMLPENYPEEEICLQE